MFEAHDGDGNFTSGEVLSGIQGLGNPLAAPTVVSAGSEDVLLTNNIDGSGAINTTLDAGNQHGRISWRELEP